MTWSAKRLFAGLGLVGLELHEELARQDVVTLVDGQLRDHAAVSMLYALPAAGHLNLAGRHDGRIESGPQTPAEHRDQEECPRSGADHDVAPGIVLVRFGR